MFTIENIVGTFSDLFVYTYIFYKILKCITMLITKKGEIMYQIYKRVPSWIIQCFRSKSVIIFDTFSDLFTYFLILYTILKCFEI